MSKLIAFVASTLPASIVSEDAKLDMIDTVWTSCPALLSSYAHILNSSPNIRIKALPRMSLLQALSITCILIRARIFGCDIVFFHECCWPVLDSLIWILKPSGYFVPQNKIINYTKAPRESTITTLRRMRFSALFVLGPFARLFSMHKCINDGGASELTAPVVKGYPRGISVLERSNLRPQNEMLERPEIGKAKVIFLVGTDAVDTLALRRLYEELIQIVWQAGFIIEIKDHPNEKARLNLNIDIDRIRHLDPTRPAELIDKNYIFAVGAGSASLSTFGACAVSIIEIIDEMDHKTRELRKNYISSLNGYIKFPKTVTEFSAIFKA